MFKDNQLTMLRHTHPKLFSFLMKKGMGDELLKLAQTKSNGRINLASIFEGNAEELLQMRPCAFDDIGERVKHDGIDFAYDPDEE